MTGIQFIERDGKREFAVIPIELYERLSAALEDADDAALFDAARAADDGFRSPATVVNAILDGEQPVKVWREHRGLTQDALAGKAGISKAYLCQIETRKRVDRAKGLLMQRQGLSEQAAYEKLRKTAMDKGLKLVADYYASVGKLGIEKATEGDQRTPLGVYFITSRLDPATLKDFYGAGALPINYPNPLDQVRGKTGSGIWLHGTPPDQFSRAPLATDGCVALANPDLERILRTVEPRSTPVVIAKQLQWVQAHSVQAERNSFEAVLNAWSAAKSEGNMNRLLGFYAPDFQSHKKMPLSEWATVLQTESQALKGRPVHLKDKAYLRWTDSADTMVVTFGEVAAGARTGPVKRQFWARRGNRWQIFFEGVIG